MQRNGIWLYVLGSFVLHVVAVILFARAASVSEANRRAIEVFIIVPPAVTARAAGEHAGLGAMPSAMPGGQETNRLLAGQKRNVRVSRPVHVMPVVKPRKTDVPASGDASAALERVENDTAIPAYGASATSGLLGEGSKGKPGGSLQSGTEQPVEMSLGDAGAPRFIHREPPAYPFLARKLGKEGSVVLRLTLDERGGQKDIEVLVRDGYGFTEAAVQALKKSILSPAQKDGKPVVSRVLIPVRFVLREN